MPSARNAWLPRDAGCANASVMRGPNCDSACDRVSNWIPVCSAMPRSSDRRSIEMPVDWLRWSRAVVLAIAVWNAFSPAVAMPIAVTADRIDRAMDVNDATDVRAVSCTPSARPAATGQRAWLPPQDPWCRR
jgi:hypothetical protein